MQTEVLRNNGIIMFLIHYVVDKNVLNDIYDHTFFYIDRCIFIYKNIQREQIIKRKVNEDEVYTEILLFLFNCIF